MSEGRRGEPSEPRKKYEAPAVRSFGAKLPAFAPPSWPQGQPPPPGYPPRG